jgi:phosphate-selective porin
MSFRGISMLRTSVCLAAMLLVAGSLHTASAQTAAPAATTAPAATAAPAAAKPSRMKLTAEKLKDMKAKWSANKGKLKACRKEVKSKGLAGDDRWFYIEDCMDKT